MNILYLAHRIPYPPNKGDKIRSFHEIRYFSQRHNIHLMAFSDQPGDEKHLSELEKYCRSVTLVPLHRPRQYCRAALSMLIRKPWTLGYFSCPAMEKTIRSNKMSFDLTFIYSSSMAPYSKLLNGVPKILDFVDSDASKWLQYAKMKPLPMNWMYGWEGKNLGQYESNMIREFDFSIFVSKREIKHLPEAIENKKIHFIQNGIDLDFFTPVRPKGSGRTILFTGAMDYYPNVDAVCYFARKVMPLVRSSMPDARFMIVGSNPTRQVKHLRNIPGVTVTGFVKDTRPFFADAGVAVVPIRISQGIQNKLLEALASGLPVVATKEALEGLAHTSNLTVAEANGTAQFAERVIEYLKKPLTTAQIEVSRRTLQSDYSWDLNLSSFDRLFEKLYPGHSTT
ncbi:MAG: TIGR03087 family PEP-CTERM/XrtA system glycosyltransferase [Acidobacteria bacterium]|nr:TIGR03087 family PEP-CTERM/XrtA system glycosyltransferase [Acidobacteriota bacterium]